MPGVLSGSRNTGEVGCCMCVQQREVSEGENQRSHPGLGWKKVIGTQGGGSVGSVLGDKRML